MELTNYSNSDFAKLVSPKDLAQSGVCLMKAPFGGWVICNGRGNPLTTAETLDTALDAIRNFLEDAE